MFKTKKYKAIIGLAAIVSCALGVRTYAMIESLETPTHTNEIKKDKATYLNSLASDTKAILEMTTKLRENMNFSEISKTTPEFEYLALLFLFKRRNFIDKLRKLINIFDYAIPLAPALNHANDTPYLINISLQRIPGNPQDIQTKLKNFYSSIKDIYKLNSTDFDKFNKELKYKFENLKNVNKLDFISLLDTQSIREAGVDFSKIYKTITRAESAFPTFFKNNENTQSINTDTTNYNDIYIYTLNHLNALYEFFNELFNKLIEFYSNNEYVKEYHAHIKNSNYNCLVQIMYYIRNSFVMPATMFYQQMYDRICDLKKSKKLPIASSAKTLVKNARANTIPTLNRLANSNLVDYFSSTNPSNLSNSNTNNKKLLSDLDPEAMKLYKKNSLKFALDAYDSLHSTLTLMLERHFFKNNEQKVYPFHGIDFDKIQQLISSIPQFLKLYQANTVVNHNLDMCELENYRSMANYVKELTSLKNTIPLLALFYIFIECCYYARSTFGFSSDHFRPAFKKIKKIIFEMTNPNTDKSNDNSNFVNTLSECLGTIKATILHIIVSSNIQLAPASMDYITYDSHYWFDKNKYSSEIVPTIQEDISSLSNATDPISSNIISTARTLMLLKIYFYKK